MPGGKNMKKTDKNSCPVTYTLSLLGGKWKLPVIHYLLQHGQLRFRDLEQKVPGITPKMLTKVLKELEEENMVSRESFAEVPPRTEYRLTPCGRSLEKLLMEIEAWGETQLQQQAAIRRGEQ